MTRVSCLAAAVATAITAVLTWPVQGSALEIDTTLSNTSVVLGSSTNFNEDVVIIHNQSGFAKDVVLTGTLPEGFVVNSVTLRPSLVLGEIWWNDADLTRILTIDIENGDRLNVLDLTLQGLPFVAAPCGLYGLDVHPTTGELYGMIGLYPAATGCDYTTSRGLFKINPENGIATFIGEPPLSINGLTFTPDGRLFGHGGNGASRRGGLYQLDLVTGGASLFVATPIPGAAITWDDPAMAGTNFEDGLIYHFHMCSMATTNPGTRAQSSIQSVSSNCPNDGMHAVTDLGDDKFLLMSWGERYIFDRNTLNWDYQGSDDEGRGAIGAGHFKTYEAACTNTNNTFTCTIPRIVPLGQYAINFDADYTPTSAGNQQIVLKAGDQTKTVAVKVVASDLKAFAEADKNRVDGGGAVVWAFEAENVGSEAAANTQLIITLPANQTYVSHSTLTGSCSRVGQVLTCNVGTVGAGNLARVTVNTTGGANGAGDATVTVSTTTTELTGDDNTASARVVVGPAADLETVIAHASAKDGTSPTDKPGAPIPLIITVTNNGPYPATSVTLKHTPPVNLTLSSADPSQGSCAVAGGNLTCNLGNIAVGKSVTIDAKPTATLSGVYPLKATAESSVTPDMVPENNTGELRLNVTPPSLVIAAGKSLGTVSGEKAAVAQLVLTHGGETEQALSVKSLSFKVGFSGLNLTTVRALVIEDIDGDGVADEDEPVIGNGDLTANDDQAGVRLSGRGLELEKGKTITVLIVLRDSVSSQVAFYDNGAMVAMLGALPLALLIGFRRRKDLQIAALALFVMGSAACAEDEATVGAEIRLTVTGAEVELAEGASPLAPVEGLPLRLPAVEVK